jgi:hypothetical protein
MMYSLLYSQDFLNCLILLLFRKTLILFISELDFGSCALLKKVPFIESIICITGIYKLPGLLLSTRMLINLAAQPVNSLNIKLMQKQYFQYLIIKSCCLD